MFVSAYQKGISKALLFQTITEAFEMSHSPPVEDPVVVPVWIYNFAKYISQGKYIFAILCASALVIILFGLGIASYALIRYIDRRYAHRPKSGTSQGSGLTHSVWLDGRLQSLQGLTRLKPSTSCVGCMDGPRLVARHPQELFVARNTNKADDVPTRYYLSRESRDS